jgi:hypothetical protein
MSWGHYYHEEQVCYDTPTYYNEPNRDMTSDNTPFDDVYIFDVTCHTCDDFTSPNSYPPHLVLDTTPIHYDYTEPFSDPQHSQYNLGNSYDAPHGSYNAQAVSHSYAAPNEHREVVHLEDVLYHLLECEDSYPGPSDGHQGPLSGQYKPQETPHASHNAQYTCDMAEPNDVSLANEEHAYLENEPHDMSEHLDSPHNPTDDPSSTLHNPLDCCNNPDDGYNAARPQDVSLANGERTNFVNGPYDIQEHIYNYTD